jgi:RND superfamily putative drug exporter
MSAQSRDRHTALLRDGFYRLGVAMARRRRTVVAVWLAAAGLGLVLLPYLVSSLASPPYEVSGSESQRASADLQRSFPLLGNESTLLVLHSEQLTVREAVFRAAIDASMTALSRQPGVSSVAALPLPGDPRSAPVLADELAPIGELYADERTAYVMVNVAGDTQLLQERSLGQGLAAGEAARGASGGAVSAYLVGMPSVGHDLQRIQLDDLFRAELIAIPVTLLVLLVGLRAPLAALLPLAVAGAAVLVTTGVLTMLSPLFTANGMLLIAVTAVGLGVGTDYALFVVARYREGLAGGASPERSAGAALASNGRTALYSGLVVILAVVCLLGIRWEAYTHFMVGVTIVIAAQVAAVLTLLPAALVLMSRYLEWRPLSRRRIPATGAAGEGWARWCRHLMRHPWPYLVGVTAGLVILAAPAADLRLGIDMERQALSGTPTGTGIALMEREPIGGVTGMAVVVVEWGTPAVAPDTEPLLSTLRADPLVAAVTSVHNDRDRTAVFVIPQVGADSPLLAGLVHRIRGDIVPRAGLTALVTGPGAMVVDLGDEVTGKLWWVIGAVLALMYVLLVVVFRSLLLPLKAIVLNALVTAAAFGLMVLVFQHGLGEDLGFTSPGLIWVHVPLAVFTVVFALSLDYELFLVRRIQEEYLAGGDNTAAVVAGVRHTARTITLAALIMVAAFGGLLAASIVGVKELGFATAVAILLDASVVRLALVPALMQVLGRWNWWLPFASRPAAARREPVGVGR